MSKDRLLYDYWRSSASYRVRIALNIKGLEYRQQSVHLVRDGGEQRQPDYLALNPQGLVPTLQDGPLTLTQSLAICEYLEEQYPEPPLLPDDAAGRARVRALSLLVACEIHPLNNLQVLQYLTGPLAQDEAAKLEWYRHWVGQGFHALEQHLSAGDASGRYCHGDEVSLADVCLVPQVYNAERFECDLEPYPRLREITARCRALPAFAGAAPQPPAEAVIT